MAATFTVGRLRLDVVDYLVEERCGQHDLVTIEGIGGRNLQPYVGQPAKLDIVTSGLNRTIVGYLDKQAVSTGYTRDTLYVGYSLGASSMMRSGSERQWKDKRPFDIAVDIVQPYNFCLEMDRFDTTFPLFVQHNESDWQTLSRL